MQRSRVRSASQPQPRDDEMRSMIDSQLQYINATLKDSVRDFNHFITILNARKKAEDAFIQSLKDIPTVSGTGRNDPSSNPSGPTPFSLAMQQYDRYITKTISFRNEISRTMKLQVMTLEKVRNDQESLRRSIKNKQDKANLDFTMYLTKEFPKAHKAYLAKNADLEGVLAASGITDDTESEHATLVDEKRKSGDSWQDVDSSVGGPHGPTPELPQKRGMAMLKAQMAQMRTQLANATAPAPIDPSKHNVRLAKLKRDADDADRDYRKAIANLEAYRQAQMSVLAKNMQKLEKILIDRTNETKMVLDTILTFEQNIRDQETKLNEITREYIKQMDCKKDIELFYEQYNQKQFTSPPRIYYEHHERGRFKNLQFGIRLQDYAQEHHTTVPVLVLKCIHAVESHGGLQKEGIYRVSCRQSNLDALKIEFEMDEDAVNLDTSKHDIHTITSVLKLFMREMQDPLFPFPLQDRIKYSNVADTNLRLRELQNRLSKLTDPQRHTLRAIIEHLAKVNAMSHINKMNLQNLSVIFTPSIFHDHNQAENPGEWCADRAFEDLVLYHDILFSNAEAQHNAEQPHPRKNISESSRYTVMMNSTFTQESLPPLPLLPQAPPDHASTNTSPLFNDVKNDPVTTSVTESSEAYHSDPYSPQPAATRGSTHHAPLNPAYDIPSTPMPKTPSRKDSTRRTHNPRSASASASAGTNVLHLLPQTPQETERIQERSSMYLERPRYPSQKPDLLDTPSAKPPPKNVSIEQK